MNALMLLSDAETGTPLALLSARTLTAIRTGAGSGLATDLLARPDASVCAVIGAGVQAERQLEAVCAVRPIRRALVVSRSPDRAGAFADRMARQLEMAVEVVDRERLSEADVICVATNSPTPVLFSGDVAPGTHINAVGAHHPQQAELEAALVRRAHVVVDHRATCAAEAGDLLLAGLDVNALAEIGELVDSAPRAARETSLRPTDLSLRGAPATRQSRHPEHTDSLDLSDPRGDEVTLFKSVGNAVQDLAAAAHVVAVARREGLGTRVEL